MASDLQVPFIKADSIIDISIGTLLIQQLQGLATHLSKDVDAEGIKGKLDAKEPLSVTEQGLVSLTFFLSEVYKTAIDQGKVYYKPLDETLKGALGKTLGQ